VGERRRGKKKPSEEKLCFEECGGFLRSSGKRKSEEHE
jgi:hypothetical protein